MSTRFFTNENSNTLLQKFEGVFSNNPDLERFDALVGYLRASGYFAIRPFIKNLPEVRILVGINVDPILEAYQKKGQLFLADANQALKSFREGLSLDVQQARYSPEVEEGMQKFLKDVVSGKLQIKAHPTRRLHAKIYIFLPKGFNEHKPGHVITGSSNLTASGLGAAHSDNQTYEFNVLSHDFEDVQFAEAEFEKLWKEAITVLPKEVSSVLKDSYLREDLTPFDLYYKLLIEYFGPAIEYDPNSETDLPEGFMRLAYQMDAVTQGFLLLQKHHGFFLSDVVGLGKTVIAILIAKKFFYHNGFPGHLSEILLVIPPALRASWEDTIDRFNLKGVRIITNGSLHRIRKPEKYDLVLVDEAHKFRNDTAAAYDELQRICKSRSSRRLPDGSYYRKRVILISATPLNNRPDDIKNLLLLFQDGKDSTLEVPNLQRFFATRQKEYLKALKDLSAEEARKEIKRIYELIRTRVVSEITIRRTRTDLRKHDDYLADLTAQGIVFPAVHPPNKILYPLPGPLETLYDETLKQLDCGLTYNRYRAIGHLVPEKKVKYQQAERISAQLARIMRTLLLKRLDSSFHAFTKSLCRFRDNTLAMVQMFENGTIYIAPKFNVSEYIMEDREEELLEKVLEAQQDDPTIEICTPEDFEPDYLEGLLEDARILETLCQEWLAVKEDPKFTVFLEWLETSLLHPLYNHHAMLTGHPKLVIFSESQETTDYLCKGLKEAGYTRILAIHSKNRKEKMPLVRANFDANLPVTERLDDVDILISTEVLAEGVNLHRSNVVLNYDTPWNATRLMQRIGRINRIGTTAEQIHVFNFFPTAKVEADIELKKKAMVKLQAFHTALGEDSQIYSTDEEVDTFGLFDRDLEEERDESLSLLMELRKLRQQDPERFRQIRNLPLRARVGRKDKTKDHASITFVRNKRRDGFYYLHKDQPVEELSFVEAARIFHAIAKEKAISLPEYHHEHVNRAVMHYHETLRTEAVKDQIVDHQIGPNERKALGFLNLFIQYPNLASEEEKRLLKHAQTAVRRAAFVKLQRDLNKLENAHKKTPLKPAALLDKTLEIIDRYDLSAYAEGEVETRSHHYTSKELEPEIILSESFSK